MPFAVGLTGGIGSGKSRAAAFFVELGAAVIDTDQISHSLTKPGMPALRAIHTQFGGDVFQSDGSLDRAKLRQRIFSDPEAKARLEGILHPLIRMEVLSQLGHLQAPYAVLVVPLLLETGNYRELVNRILVVDCAEPTQISRTMARSGLSEAEVRAILANQIPRAQRLQAADDIIDNNGNEASLHQQVVALHERYRGLAQTMPN